MPTCIVCWENTSAISDEHVIPEALGGHYHIKSVCRDCNSRMGSHVDSMLVNHTFSKFGRYVEKITGTAYAHGSGRESLPPDVEVEVRAGERVEYSLYVPADGATT